MSAPGPGNDSSYGESSRLVCSCSSGNEQSCPVHRPQPRTQYPPIRLHGPEMQAFARPVAYPHHIADQRLHNLASNLPVYGTSFQATSSTSSTAEPRSQQAYSYVPGAMSSGYLTYQSETPARAQPIPYAVSPDAVWSQGTPSQLMPAIDMPQQGQPTMQHLTPLHEQSGMFAPQASAGMPAPTHSQMQQHPQTQTQQIQNTPASAYTSTSHSESYSPHQAASTTPSVVSPGDNISWNVFAQDPAPRPNMSSFASTSEQAYSFGHQTAGLAPSQPALPMGWVPNTVGRQGPLKAETLPPASPGLQEDDPSLHRHVSAPSTPITPLEASRAYSIADFRHGPPPVPGLHATGMLSSSAHPLHHQHFHHHQHHHHPHQHQHQHHLHGGSVPFMPISYRPMASRPATSAGLILDPSPVPFLDRTFGTDDAKYEAVLARSHAADRAFVCAAATTRIYCRPSCASKRPDRSRLRFFSNPNAAEKAEQAGFRPCKRCKPQTPGTADQCVLAVGDCARHMVMTARNPSAGTGNDDDDDEIRRGTLKEYSARANLSAFHFHRTFKAVTSVTLGELGKALNTLALQDSLGEWTPPQSHVPMAGPSSLPMRASPPPAEDIAHLLVGWSTRRARRALGGLSPSTYAAGCPEAVVRLVSTESAFGPVAIAYLDPLPDDTTRGSVSVLSQINSSPMPVAAEEGTYFGQYATNACTIDAAPLSPPPNAILLTCVLGQDATATVQRRFPTATAQPSLAPWLISIVEELHRTGSREVQLPPEIVGAIRRARVYIEVMHQMVPKRSSSDHGLPQEGLVSSSSTDAA